MCKNAYIYIYISFIYVHQQNSQKKTSPMFPPNLNLPTWKVQKCEVSDVKTSF